MQCQPTFLPPSSPDSTARRKLSALLRQFALRRCDGNQLTERHKQIAQATDALTLWQLLSEHRFFLLEADGWDTPSTGKRVRLADMAWVGTSLPRCETAFDVAVLWFDPIQACV